MAWVEKEVKHDIIEAWQSCKCSYCNTYLTTPYLYSFKKYNFCPNCGCDMRTYPRDIIKQEEAT